MSALPPARVHSTGPAGLVWVVCCALAGMMGCAGTESAIFESTALKPDAPVPTVMPPPDSADVGTPIDAGADPFLPVPITEPGEDEDAGAHVDPGLDPDADFSWTETLPGAGTCKAGRYVGGFECTMPGLNGFPVSISGEIAFTLTGSPEEQTLLVEDGSISGYYFSAPLSGSLSCTGDSFSGLSEGTVVSLGPWMFVASLEGVFDDQALGIEGVFSMLNDENQTCDGTFGAGIAP